MGGNGLLWGSNDFIVFVINLVFGKVIFRGSGFLRTFLLLSKQVLKNLWNCIEEIEMLPLFLFFRFHLFPFVLLIGFLFSLAVVKLEIYTWSPAYRLLLCAA